MSTQLIKTNYLVILPPTQHRSFFRNLPPLFINERFYNMRCLVIIFITAVFFSIFTEDSSCPGFSQRRVVHVGFHCSLERIKKFISKLSEELELPNLNKQQQCAKLKSPRTVSNPWSCIHCSGAYFSCDKGKKRTTVKNKLVQLRNLIQYIKISLRRPLLTNSSHLPSNGVRFAAKANIQAALALECSQCSFTWLGI